MWFCERVFADECCSTAPLAAHLASQNVEFMQFAFRWMNCLLMREISVRNTIRMWDTYLVSGLSHYLFAIWILRYLNLAT